MDLESLIRKLTREILETLHSREDGPAIMVFGKRKDSYTEPVLSLFRKHSRIFFLDDDWQEQAVDRYILPLMTLNQMGDLVNGMARGRVAGAVLATLLKGKTVEVAAYGHEAYLETAPEPLLRVYDAQKRTLAGFGVKPLAPAAGKVWQIRQRLVTEKVVQQAGNRRVETLKVPADACVTPLAAETAGEAGINILKQ